MRKLMIYLLMKFIESDDVEWVTNNIGELGIKLSNRFFFLYKGNSLEYKREEPRMQWRHVYKREFGEVAHPYNFNYNEFKDRFDPEGNI